MALSIEAVRAFVLVADLGSLTRAAEAAGSVQPVVSQRLKALEASLGRRLLDRSPRHVRLTPAGEDFLDRARTLLAAHDAALTFSPEPQVRFALGLSDHAVGQGLEAVLRRLREALPGHASIAVTSGLSADIATAFEAGTLDAAILRRENAGPGGEVLGTDPVGWRAAENYRVPSDGVIPLAVLPAPCGVRAAAMAALEKAGRPWREAFTAGSCAAVVGAVRAGMGIAPMGRAASGGLADLGPMLGLPELSPSEIVLQARVTSPAIGAAVRALAATVRANLRPSATHSNVTDTLGVPGSPS